MSIKMFNMEFGECNLIEDSNDCLVVDFGSILKGKDNSIFKSVEKHILKTTPNKIEGLISHFHEDHYNGFIHQLFSSTNKIKYDGFYLPHIFQCFKHPNVFDYVLIDTYIRTKIGKKHPKENVLDLINYIFKSGASYTLLKRGDTFNAPGGKATVLWPDPMNLHSRINELNDFLYLPDKIVYKIFETSDTISNILAYEEVGNKLNETISSFNSLLYQDTLSLDNESVISDGIIKTYTGVTFKANSLEEFYSRADIKLLLSEITKKRIDHEYCIVFQNEHFTNNCLFTGDINASILNDLLDKTNPNMIKHYYAVKAPHHGTKSHYCPNLFNNTNVRIKKVFISNGDGNKRYGKISKEYTNKSFDVICTNSSIDRCEKQGKCKSRLCGIDQKSTPVFQTIDSRII